jgi:hypothetical protein
MDGYHLARARIGAARMLMSQQEAGPSRNATSTLQCSALCDIILRDGSCYSPEQKAAIGEQVLGASFNPPHEQRILEMLLEGSDGKRRKSQNATAFLNYLSVHEWDKLTASTMCSTDVGQFLLDVIMHRLGVVNPSEPTKKLVASASLILSTPADSSEELTSADKNAMRTWVDKARLRMRNHINKALATPSVEYCRELPSDPEDLKIAYPLLYAQAKIDGCWTKSRLNERSLMKVEASYQCRNTDKAVRNDRQVALVPSGSMGTPFATPQMQMMMQMMAQVKMCTDTHRRLGGVSSPLGRPSRNREIVSCRRNMQLKRNDRPFPFPFQHGGGFPFSL